MSKIGFVGLGIMGKPMAGQLIKAGHEVFLSSHSNVPKELTDAGGKACANSKEVAEQAEIIITMVPDTPHVQAALFDDGGNKLAVDTLRRGKRTCELIPPHRLRLCHGHVVSV